MDRTIPIGLKNDTTRGTTVWWISSHLISRELDTLQGRVAGFADILLNIGCLDHRSLGVELSIGEPLELGKSRSNRPERAALFTSCEG